MRCLLLLAMIAFATPAHAEEAKAVAPVKETPVTAEAPCIIHLDEDFTSFDLNLDGKVYEQEVMDMPSVDASPDELKEMKETRRLLFQSINTDSDDFFTKEDLLAFDMKIMPNCTIK